MRREITDPDLRARIGDLAGLIKRQLTYASANAGEVLLTLMAGHMWCHRADEVLLYVRTVTDAGGSVPPQAVAVIRRTVASGCYGSLAETVRRITVPRLNMSEAWADAVLAELPELGDTWAALVAHVNTATSRRSRPHGGPDGHANCSPTSVQRRRATR